MAQNDTKSLKPRRYLRRASCKEARQARFLYFFLDTPNKTEAAKRSGVPIRTVHRWFCKDPAFYSNAKGIFETCHIAILHRRVMEALERLNSRI
jgi:hypothetical protein